MAGSGQRWTGRAAVLRKIGQPMEVEQISLGPLGPEDVLVRVKAASLCHTDLEVIEGQLACPLPAVLGHEAAGTIAMLGEAVPGQHPSVKEYSGADLGA